MVDGLFDMPNWHAPDFVGIHAARGVWRGLGAVHQPQYERAFAAGVFIAPQLAQPKFGADEAALRRRRVVHQAVEFALRATKAAASTGCSAGCRRPSGRTRPHACRVRCARHHIARLGHEGWYAGGWQGDVVFDVWVLQPLRFRQVLAQGPHGRRLGHEFGHHAIATVPSSKALSSRPSRRAPCMGPALVVGQLGQHHHGVSRAQTASAARKRAAAVRPLWRPAN